MDKKESSDSNPNSTDKMSNLKPNVESNSKEKNININSNFMDDNNKKAYDVMKTEGTDAAVKFMFQHPTEKKDDGKPRKMSYAEMRSFYG